MSDYLHLNKRQANPPRIYRGVVYSVETSADERKTIWIKEYGTPDEPPFTEALPPALLPIDPLGSGVVSMPTPGTNCIVLEGAIGDSSFGRAQILTYLPQRGLRHEGTMSSDTLEDGDFLMKIGGQNRTIFQMTKGGEMSWFAGKRSFFTVDGLIEKTSQASKRYHRKNSVGVYRNEWIEFDPLQPTVYERTSHLSSFGLRPESPMDSDTFLDTEEAAIIPILSPYVNKSTVRAGKIPNKRQMVQDSATHTYTIDTRASSLGSYYKDAVTKLEFGWQGGHYPDKGMYHRSPGNLIHLTAKRNTPGNVGTFLLRYGKLEYDSGTKVPLAPASTTIPEDLTKGEIYRQQIYQNLNFGVPLGMPPVPDPLGEGKGYKATDESTAMQAYVTSMGKLESPLLLVDRTYGSLWRRRFQDQVIAETGFYSTEHIGGQGQIPGGAEPDYYYKEMSSKAGGVAMDKLTERFGKTLMTGGYDYTLVVEDEIVQHKTELKMAPLETKLENSTLGGTVTSTLRFDHGPMPKVTLGNSFGPLASNYIEVGQSDITIASIDGTASIKVDGMTGTVTITGGTPVTGIPNSELEISPTGVKVNGVGLATANFVNWMVQNSGFISIGAMGPNAISPAALPTLMLGGNLATWIPGQAPLAFKTA